MSHTNEHLRSLGYILPLTSVALFFVMLIANHNIAESYAQGSISNYRALIIASDQTHQLFIRYFLTQLNHNPNKVTSLLSDAQTEVELCLKQPKNKTDSLQYTVKVTQVSSSEAPNKGVVNILVCQAISNNLYGLHHIMFSNALSLDSFKLTYQTLSSTWRHLYLDGTES